MKDTAQPITGTKGSRVGLEDASGTVIGVPGQLLPQVLNQSQNWELLSFTTTTGDQQKRYRYSFHGQTQRKKVPKLFSRFSCGIGASQSRCCQNSPAGKTDARVGPSDLEKGME